MLPYCVNFDCWQTYVLDVHPFNPRIAMSAGYDGKTIVWDVSFWFFNVCYHSICYFLLVVEQLVCGVSRYGKAYLSGHMKLDALSWLMENFPRK